MKLNILVFTIMVSLICSAAFAQTQPTDQPTGTQSAETQSAEAQPSVQQASEQPPATTPVITGDQPTTAAPEAPVAPAQLPAVVTATTSSHDEVLYTLGPDDVIEITVQRHPEFSGTFPINQEGKIQYEFVGDLQVTGMTKKQLEERLRQLISRYVANPVVNVTITDYRSKFYFVIGDVGHPGKYYMRSETTTVRDAIVEAGLPTLSAAIRKVQLITPDKNGRPRKKAVNLYAILYAGNLKHNIDVRPGDVLYIPSTVMAKVFRTIAPITEPVTAAAEAQTGVTSLNTRPENPRPRTGN
ncbi:MAG TPA: polysaccharide biosynthesis/export family protein [Candidatus Omnitrophota bacterium]|nr:polysaccharide biosynthesis/export family protein [Candidatus Omnitrophota bacterium]HRZ15637.1 polysaccharide biosynthesis/export family protein [Candidatus Omnitrophota bacterium]